MRSRQQDERLRNIVEEHLDTVARVLRNAGVSESQLDDELQRTLITVARRLDDIRPGAEKSFLIQIALRVAAHARRTVARRREVTADELDADGLSVVDAVGSTERRPSPENLTNQKRMRDALDRILEGMEDDLREVFVLYEFEEMSMIEISGVLGIPQGTVASRLRRARATFRERVVELGLVEGAPVPKLVGS
jgi:RNA polymerase sigma-70 factor (ECF subfamily)